MMAGERAGIHKIYRTRLKGGNKWLGSHATRVHTD